MNIELTDEVKAERDKLGKPRCQLLGIDGNAFSIMGAVNRVLRNAGYSGTARDAFREEAMSGNYDHVIQTALDWIDEGPDDDFEVEGDDDE